MPRYLTKSLFKTGMDCPTKLFYIKKEKEYANMQQEDTFLQSLAEGGFQVEELARLHYPNGVLIEDSEDRSNYYEHCIKQTKKALEQENVIIYEAAFLHQSLFIRTDILVKKGNNIQLIEVKAKSFNSTDQNILISEKSGKISGSYKTYIYDLAFQKHVTQLCHPNWNIEASFFMADKSKKASIDGLNQLFRINKKTNKRTGIDVLVKSLAEVGEPVLGLLNADEAIQLIFDDKDRVIENLSFYEMINLFAEHYTANKKMNYPIGWHCKSCEFKNDSNPFLKSGFEECWTTQTKYTQKQLAVPNIFDVWRFTKGKKILENQKFLLSEITEDEVGLKTDANQLTSSHRQWIQIEKTIELEKTGKSVFYLDAENLKLEMNTWVYPYHFIDFETSAVALPFTKGTAPYEQTAFQFSHHIVYENGKVEHKTQFLLTQAGVFPNFEFVRALKSALNNDSGSVFKYATHENSILNAIYSQLQNSAETDKEELQEFIKVITHSNDNSAHKWVGERDMIDLCDLVRKYFYHPYMKGSNSIKAVLPTVLKISPLLQQKYGKPISENGVTSLNFNSNHIWLKDPSISPYKSLEQLNLYLIDDSISNMESIQDGGAALTAYGKLQYQNMSENEREAINNGLLKYCELDTLAMVMIWEFLNQEINL